MDIVTFPHESLRRQAADVPHIDKKIQKLCRQMIRVLGEAHGIGLAAPQVDVPLRLFVVMLPGMRPSVYINPTIVARSQRDEWEEEGCLSLPGIFASVRRPAEIEIKAWDEKERPISIGADGMLARVIQHEYDHLEGMMFFDYLPAHQRTALIDAYTAQCE